MIRVPQASSLERKRKKGGGKAGKSDRKSLSFLKAHVSIFVLIYLFYFNCAGSSLLGGFSLVEASGATFQLWCVGPSLYWLLLLQSTGPRAYQLQ